MRGVAFKCSHRFTGFSISHPRLMSAGVALGKIKAIAHPTAHELRGVAFQVFPSLYRVLGIRVHPLLDWLVVLALAHVSPQCF